MALVVMDYVLMAYVVMDYVVMTHVVMACIVTARLGPSTAVGRWRPAAIERGLYSYASRPRRRSFANFAASTSRRGRQRTI